MAEIRLVGGEAAAVAYDIEAIRAFGRYAHTNILLND